MSRYTVVVLALITGVVMAFFIAGNSDAAEPSGEFYQWTLPNGDVNMTDDAKRIPDMYKDIAVKRSFAQVGEDAKVTEMTISGADYASALEASLERSRKLAARTAVSPRAEECEGPITVVQERRDYEERGHRFNSLFYIVKDACGKEVSVTRNAPIPLIRTIRNR